MKMPLRANGITEREFLVSPYAALEPLTFDLESGDGRAWRITLLPLSTAYLRRRVGDSPSHTIDLARLGFIY
jgi:hypothetical protein